MMGAVLIPVIVLFGLAFNNAEQGTQLNTLEDAKVFIGQQISDNQGIQYERLND